MNVKWDNHLLATWRCDTLAAVCVPYRKRPQHMRK